jgi:hypothetical protein
MSRASSEYKTAAAESAIKTAWLVAIPELPKINDPSTTIELFFTSWPEGIVYDGDTYLPSPLHVDPPKISQDMERSSGSAALCNLGNEFSAYAKQYRIKDSKIVVLHGILTATGWVVLPSFTGIMDAPSIEEQQISVSISNGRSVTMLLPRILYSVRDFPHLPSAKDPRTLSLK